MSKQHRIESIVQVLGFVLMSAWLGAAVAALPESIRYQGYLSDPDGSPLNSPANIRFRLYNVPSGGIPLWSDTQLVAVDKGLFNVELGPGAPFPPNLFDDPLWLGVEVEADGEMSPRQPLTSTGYAFKASDADTLEGVSSSTLDQSAHLGDSANPHNVSAVQTGSASAEDLSNHTSDAAAHHTRYNDSNAVAAILASDGPGSGLDADLLGGISSGFFVQTFQDFGRPGVSLELYEGAQTLSAKYVNEGQVNSIVSSMIVNGGVTEEDIALPLSLTGENANAGLLSSTNTSYNSGIGVFGYGQRVGLKGEAINGPTKGYLGVQGIVDFDGELDLDISGSEIGVLGYSSGTSITDNYGLYGSSNGTGIYAEGGVLAGKFVGDVAVSGDISVSQVTYRAPRTHYYSVGDGDFHTWNGDAFVTSSSTGGTYFANPQSGAILAGLHLPDGAVITQFQVIIDDTAPGDLSVSIHRRAHTGVGFSSLADVTSSGTPGIVTLNDSTFTNPTVDNLTFAYHVRAYSASWPGNATLKIRGAIIHYTISEAD